MSAPRFHELTVARVSPEAAGAVAIAFAVPADLQARFDFQPGVPDLGAPPSAGRTCGATTRSAPPAAATPARELEVGILNRMEGGLFSNWAATQLKAGDRLAVMPPDGRFTIHKPRALHRVGFAAGSGITPILSIVSTTRWRRATAPSSPWSTATRRMSSVMFNEALQDLKDKYKNRLTLIHVLSRQAQEVPLLEGRTTAPRCASSSTPCCPPRHGRGVRLRPARP